MFLITMLVLLNITRPYITTHSSYITSYHFPILLISLLLVIMWCIVFVSDNLHVDLKVIYFRAVTYLSLTLRRLMSYIYGAPILDVSRSHTTTQQSVGLLWTSDQLVAETST